MRTCAVIVRACGRSSNHMSTGCPACAGHDSCGSKSNAAYQAAVPRRPCRQPAAHRAAQGGAGKAQERRDLRRGAEGDRRPRDREGHPQAGRRRAQLDHRRRIPAHLLELRFSRESPQRRILCGRAQDQVCRHRPAAAADPAARHRQARRLQAASDDRAFQVSQGAHAADAEADHSVAFVAAFPLRPRCGAGIDLSVDGRFLSRSRRDLSQGGARLRRCRLPLSAARRGQSRLSVRSGAAQADYRSRRRSGGAAERSMPA